MDYSVVYKKMRSSLIGILPNTEKKSDDLYTTHYSISYN